MQQMTVQNLLREGIASARGGDKAKARHLLQIASEQDPRNEVAWLWQAGLAEDPKQALTYLERVLQINPDNERARAAIKSTRLQAAISLAKAGEKAEARRLLGEVLSADPNHEAALLWMAGLTRDPQRAIEYLDRVLQINPSNENARTGRLRLQARITPPPARSQCPFCRIPAAEPLTQCPGCRAVLDLGKLDQLVANAAVDGARLTEAIRRLTSAGNERIDAEGHYHLGLAYLNLKQFDDAVRHFKFVIRLAPGGPRGNSLQAALRQLSELQRQQAADRARQTAQKTILVVDDSPTIRKVVSVALETSGHRVLTAGDATEAIERVRSGAPHLVFMDITMPGMDGYQLCKLLRQTKETAKVPIVMLSGRDGFFSKVRGKMAGSTAYITKPFKSAELLEVVAQYCGVIPAAQ